MSESSILTTTDICSGYGTATVVRDISVNILSNEIVGVIGRNGVGKSTFPSMFQHFSKNVCSDKVLNK